MLHPRYSLITILALWILAACAQPVPSPTPTPLVPTPTPTRIPPTPRPTQPPPVTVEPAPTPRPGALVIWATDVGVPAEQLKRLLIEAGQQSGTEIEVIVKSSDGLNADVRAAELAGLKLPDMFWGTQDDLALLHTIGVLQPADDGLSADALLPATITGATLANQRWGTPVAAQGALLLLYNKKLAPQAPTTTDELIDRSRKLVGSGRYGLVAGWAEARWFVAWLNAFGGTTIGPDELPALDTPQMIAALNFIKELRPSGPPAPSGYEDGVTLFRQGKAAFAIDGDWSIAGYRRYTDTLDLGIAPLPIAAATGRPSAPPLGGIYLMYSTAIDSARLAQVRAIGASLAQPAAQERIARELGLLPALRATLVSPAVTEHPVLAAAAARAELSPGLPPTRNLRCAWNAIELTLPQVLLGELNQENGAKQMQAQANQCIASGR